MLMLTAKRRQLGLTQVQLARKLGVRPETVSRLENGHFNPDNLHWIRVKRIEKALGEKAEVLFSVAEDAFQ